MALVLLTAMTLGCTVIDEARREWFGTRTQTERDAETARGGLPEGGTVMEYEGEATRPAGEPVLMWKAGNDGAIEGGGGKPPKIEYQVSRPFTRGIDKAVLRRAVFVANLASYALLATAALVVLGVALYQHVGA